MKHIPLFQVILLLALLASPLVYCQNTPAKVVAGIPVNYDESLTGTYVLPDPLLMSDGRPVAKVSDWEKIRRGEIIALFEKYQFGKVPGRPDDMTFRTFESGTPAYDGKAMRTLVTIYFTSDTSDHKADLLIYLPADASGPVPLFLNLGFSPNSASVTDKGVREGYMWGRDGKRIPAPAGSGFGAIDVEKFISEGFGVATIYYGDIEPDFAEGIRYGIRSCYLRPGQQYPDAGEWGAISAWSWGLSRVMDYIETNRSIDSKRVALFGVSRLGKTVLWTGARDQRFALVIASCSGEGGAALSRREYGENIAHMTDSTRYFYQFCANRATFSTDPGKSPVDAHMLVALMAPRPLLLQTGDTDDWSDPKGEFLAAVAAEPVYALYGKKGPTDKMPAAGVPLLNDLGYYMHEGGHGSLPADNDIFITFLKMHLSAKR